MGLSLAVLEVAKALGGSESGARFLDRIAGPAADEVGLMLQERMRVVRLKNTLRWSDRAREMLDEAGIQGDAQVPLRTLFPLLEGASLEEEDPLGERWAALIANTAAHDPEAIPPSFPAILRQMSPLDATVLTALASTTRPGEPQSNLPGAREVVGVSLWNVVFACRSDIPEKDPAEQRAYCRGVQMSLQNLQRLGLSISEIEQARLDIEADGSVKAWRRNVENAPPEIRHRITELGQTFVAACSPPESHSDAKG